MRANIIAKGIWGEKKQYTNPLRVSDVSRLFWNKSAVAIAKLNLKIIFAVR
jgi:hypothetical protein